MIRNNSAISLNSGVRVISLTLAPIRDSALAAASTAATVSGCACCCLNRFHKIGSPFGGTRSRANRCRPHLFLPERLRFNSARLSTSRSISLLRDSRSIVSALLAANWKGRYYNASIKGTGKGGPYDCRTHRVPTYHGHRGACSASSGPGSGSCEVPVPNNTNNTTAHAVMMAAPAHMGRVWRLCRR